MKIKALEPWFGGKRNMAERIVDVLGHHRAYWEPFCGSCAVLFAKERSSHETVNDLHGDLINLARVVQDQATAAELYRRLQQTLLHEDLFKEAMDRFRSSSPPDGEQVSVDRAYINFVMSWMGRNGVSGTQRQNYQMAVRWTPGGGHGGTRFQSALESIPAWHRRLQGVLILRRDAFKILESIDDAPGTAIYADPPYLAETRNLRGGGGGKYLHDFAQADHQRLAELLRRRFKRACVVVSYYDSPALTELYPDWAKIDCLTSKTLSRQNARHQSPSLDDAHEVLLVNKRAILVNQRIADRKSKFISLFETTDPGQHLA